MSHISSNSFRSDLLRALRNGFHSSFSIASTVLKEGIGLLIYSISSTAAIIPKLAWENADVSISISKGNTFIFDPDDVDTENHFAEQQVYGIVTRLIS